jgi:hypothetical protein
LSDLNDVHLTPQNFRVRYNEAMLRDAVRVFMWRRVFRRPRIWIAALLLLAFSLVSSTAYGADFITGIGLACLVCVTLFVVFVWRSHLTNTLGRLRKMSPPEADVTCREDALRISSSLGSVMLPWGSFTEIWERPAYLMLFTQSSAFNTLPTDNIPPESLAFLRAKLPPISR